MEWEFISRARKDGTLYLLLDNRSGVKVIGWWGKHNHVPIYGWVTSTEPYGEEVESFDNVTHFLCIPDDPPDYVGF